MGSHEIVLPKYVFESNLGELLARLGEARRHSEVCFDFERVVYYIPAAIVSVVSTVNELHGQRVECSFVNCENCEAFRYLQRIDLFTQVGLNLPEDFRRRSGSSDFIPVERIDPASKIAELSALLGECVDPGNGAAKQMIEWASGECILNCRQHSRAIGYVSAQYAAKRDFARIGVADCGRGILESFRSNGSRFYREGMNDTEAIALAIRPNVSSTADLPHMYGISPNRGVGLSMLRDLVRQTLGYMLVISGTGWWMQEGTSPATGGRLPRGASFGGTVCSICFRRSEIDDFNRMIREAWEVLGLSGTDSDAKVFL